MRFLVIIIVFIVFFNERWRTGEVLPLGEVIGFVLRVLDRDGTRDGDGVGQRVGSGGPP